VVAGLAHIDLERRLKAGEEARAEAYLERFPALAADPSLAVALVLREYGLRRRLGPAVSRREYLARFPRYERELQARLPPEAAEAAEAAAAAPDRVGGYELLGELGRGGMAVVLRGRDPVLGRELAVKVLHEEHQADPARVRRFVEEAQIGARLMGPPAWCRSTSWATPPTVGRTSP
jgi:hypothetical protein